MSDKKDGQDKPDVVNREDYNKVVEAHNSLKAEKEKLDSEIKQIKETETKNDKEADSKEAWEKEKADLLKRQEDLTKQVEEIKQGANKVSKGIVPPQKLNEQGQPQEPMANEGIKKELDEKLPADDFDPNRCGSNLQRYGHYKNPSTKRYTHEQLGMALSLHAGAQSANPGQVPSMAKQSKDDIMLRK